MGWFGRTAALAGFLVQPQIEAWVTRSLDGVEGAGWTSPWWAIDRAAAMRVPAVSRSRHLIVGTIGDLPLRVLRAEDVVDPQPYWAYGTDGQLGDLTAEDRHRFGLVVGQSPWDRMLWTVDDLFFYGLSCWYATRLDPADNRPTRMVRLPIDRWDVDEETGAVVDIDGHPLPAERVRLIPGPHDGILDFGRDTIITAGRLEHTVADVAAHPFRIELHQTTDVVLSDTERKALISETRLALSQNDGVLFTNSAIETKEHRLDSGDLLIGGRNAAAVDVARHASIPAALIDATSAGASLEYATLQGRNQQWIDYGLVLYMDAVEARLGMDDVVPAGSRTAFDTADLTALSAGPTGPSTED